MRKDDAADPNTVAKMYMLLVRHSGRIMAEIRVLKQMEKALCRPFMFGGVMYDSDFMHKQMKRRRLQILSVFPALVKANEMKLFLLADGELGDARQLSRDELELKEDEFMYSDSSDEDEEAYQGEEFESLNRLNDSSMSKMQTSLEINRRTTI